jgi:hypothetical protein
MFFRRKPKLKRVSILSIALIASSLAAPCYADSLRGSAGAGFQRWFASNLNTTLNNNGSPYWDYPTKYPATGDFPPGFPPVVTIPPGQNANVGYCLTGMGNCPQNFLKPDLPPGPIPFWGLAYDASADTGGGLDPKMYFKKDTPNRLQATLELQLSSSANELNEFGWFETNKNGSLVGTTHTLFKGSGTGGATPVGTSVEFKPTHYYGYYFRDVSEGNCLVSSIFVSNSCTTPPNSNRHSIAIFATDPSSRFSSYWIGALDSPGECQGADCNLGVVKVEPVETKEYDQD